MRLLEKEAYALGVVLEDLKEVAAGGRYAAAHYRLGILAAQAGDYEDAAARFTKAIEMADNRFPASHNNLSVLLARLGRMREAEREFALARSQEDSNYLDARRNLALCRARLPAEAAGQLALTTVSCASNSGQAKQLLEK